MFLDKKRISKIRTALDTLEGGFLLAASRLMAEIQEELEPIIAKALREGKVDKDFELPGRKRYMAIFESYLWNCYAGGMLDAEDEIKYLKQKRKVKFAISDYLPDPIIPEKAVKWMDGWVDRFGADYYGNASENVQKVLKSSIEEGWTQKETTDALGEYLTGASYNQRRLETIARTNATSAYNWGRVEELKQNKDFVPAVEYSAILDSRTTDVCEERNGRIFLTEDPMLDENTPPLHYNCRSVLVPIDKFTWEEMQEDGWRDYDGRKLDELMDWKGVVPPEDGFGGMSPDLRKEQKDATIRKGIPTKDSLKDEKISYIRDASGKSLRVRQYGFDESEVKALKEEILNIPPAHLQKIKEIEITNSWLTDKDFKGAPSGYYNVGGKRIVLTRYPGFFNETQRYSALDMAGTSIHEIGHHYWHTKIKSTDAGNIRKIWEATKNEGFQFANREELFADAYRWYVEGKARKIKDIEKIASQKGINISIINILERIFNE